ncbi:hypothetical protein N7493_005104 [Penicillium malachiteum]|uniref:Chromo domain-containing protein n=1 Tax=Penicillium malachiteum TaxID=1324776 RepID=A0AAD6HM02_9EURO|nr:hypothetical protein N7493_005104 [Penicillium malachiteum]
MPPPVEDMSDEESGDVPFSTAEEDSPKDEPVEENGDESNEGDDDDDEEGVYVVEKITGHDFMDDGSLMLLVKWKGYEKKEDMTYEPEEGLKEGASDAVKAYYKKIGGRPKKPSPKPAAKSGPGHKRKSINETKEEEEPASTPAAEPKKRRKSAPRATTSETPALTEDTSDAEAESNWVPRGKNWDKELDTVDTIIRDPQSNGLYALLLWTNGKKSKISIETCYEKCPKKMLKFYEQHLVFKDG